MPAEPPYRGRFAPSPSGPLHFGSLIAALGSYLQARSRGGVWLVRMEDLDRPRVRPHAADSILRSLERLGLCWDETVVYQSTRSAVYREVLDALRQRGLVYPCACTRAMIEPGMPYPGTCRAGLPPGMRGRSLRLRSDGAPVRFRDALQGPYAQDVGACAGDFIVRRADGIAAYHLAVVVDDAWQGITEVVRGTDLLESTPRQIRLQQQLGYATPDYAHLPVAVTADGRKLSKQNRAPEIDRRDPAALLGGALSFLGHPPPAEVLRENTGAVLEWAVANWSLSRVPRVLSAVIAQAAAGPSRHKRGTG